MDNQRSEAASDAIGSSSTNSAPTPPQVSLPKGGGAVRGIGEKFAANPVTGTGSLTVPIATSPGRSAFGPQLSLSYDSGAGNGAFGLGWSLSHPAITRRTDKGLPQYQDADESDIFILSGAEDLVRVLVQNLPGQWVEESIPARSSGYTIKAYRPRIEGLFARIERWTRESDGDTYWRSISKDNITTFYGLTAESRISDPDDPSRVFSWLICQSQDDKGNAIVYSYVAEDSANINLSQVNERNRSDQSRSANRYISRIKYGNTPSLLQQPDVTKLSWLFEAVFDYGEGYFQASPADAEGRVLVSASTTAANTWQVRQDPFSHYRSCFEIRAYRLCQRVLMFHHFANELGVTDYLVRTTEFTYSQNPIASVISAVTQSGYVLQDNGTFLQGSLPALELEYSQAQVQKEVREVDPASLANLPASIDGGLFRWLDLDGEGLQCVLAEQDDAWYYKRNLTPLSLAFDSQHLEPFARFEPLTEVSRLPGFAHTAAPRHQFMDLVGDGHLDCVVLDRPGAGFYERSGHHGWVPFASMPHAPNIDLDNPNLRLIDVDGDGFSDILITEQDALTYYPSLARFGFGAPIRLPIGADDEAGPAIIFADTTKSVFLADMSGDGLSDMVRVRNGEVCYWPNLGYGQFGDKVTMDEAPWFDTPDLFDPTRIRLADIDGSGVTDIIYLAANGVRIYFNQSGNAWSGPDQIMNYPPVEELSTIEALDLLGNGTACLVWSSSDPGDAGRSIRYIDLMGRQKPYLMVRSQNNLGAETRISYAPSTAFYLADRAAGRPWVTRLPFPVQVVERVETYDWISRNRFVTRYAYHHGYYDGTEREFRGFGMVEQRDTDELGVLTQTGVFPDATNIDAASYVPPILTKTWFHTGAYPMGPRVTRIYDQEYWSEPSLTPAEAAAMLLPDSPLPPELTGNEIREALRSLKGAMLRQEVYALDETPAHCLPYGVSERNYTVNMLQPFDGNRHTVFLTHARESLDRHYERTLYNVLGKQLADPRVTHAFVLEVDDFGNEMKSVAVSYGRLDNATDPLLTPADQAIQSARLVTYTESTYTNPISEDDAYWTSLAAEVTSYELTGYTPSGAGGRFQSTDFVQPTATGFALIFDSEIAYEASPTTGRQRRLIKQSRTLYRADDLSSALPLGTLESMALPFVAYKLAQTPGVLSRYQRGAENLLPTPASVLKAQAGYVLGDDQITAGLFPATDPSGNWWIPSGQVFYSPGTGDTAAQELTEAQAHFFVPRRFLDPFGNNSTVTYDTAYDLLTTQVQDAVQNIVTASNDYRVLQPALITDPNGNRSAAVFDALGLVAGTAVMGKTSETLGDSLIGFAADLTQTQIDQFFADPEGPVAATLLAGASSRIVYDVGRFARPPSTPAAPLPNYAATIARETHLSSLTPSNPTSKLQIAFSYSDGLGRVIQKTGQANPGPLAAGGTTVDPRWIVSGWAIFNNKGKPVRQYEPFFAGTHDFEFGMAVGVSPILFYDPVGRVVATLYPNQTWGKVLFDPWRQDTWDSNDTVLITDPGSDSDVGQYFQRIPNTEYLPTWYTQRSSLGLGPDEQAAAQKASVHANTPGTVHFDTLGRAFLTFAYNRYIWSGSTIESHDRTLVEFDIEGNQLSITDALGRQVMTYDYDMLGSKIHSVSIDASARWMLNDISGKPLMGWDSRDHRLRYEYDALRRSTSLFVQTGSSPETQAERALYGEGQPSDQALNLRGKLYQQFDGAGLAISIQFDFKGNLLSSSRQLILSQDFTLVVDWSTTHSLDTAFTNSTSYDALNRPITLTAPDGSVLSPAYNKSGLPVQVNGVVVKPGGANTSVSFVTNIDYDAKGQRQQIDYGNGASTSYGYDPLTFRLTSLYTARPSASFPGDDPTPPNPPRRVQNLAYTYDPVGNITQIRDDSQQTIYFNNAKVPPLMCYTYDALYRLIQSTGREAIGQVTQPQTTYDDGPRMNQTLPNDWLAMCNYTEAYQYDVVGNFLALIHTATSGNWTRSYAYDEPIVPPANNRLTSSTANGVKDSYTYDAHGNILTMPQLVSMVWDFKDQLQATQTQIVNDGPGPQTYYVYGASGQRIRKVTESASGTIAYERIYLGGFEVYREYGSGGTITLERQTLHVMDDKQRVSLVENLTQGTDGSPAQLIRYQFSNHLGSASLELDEGGQIISYEEYYPFGSTSYQAVNRSLKAAAKRYRFTGKERDEETGV